MCKVKFLSHSVMLSYIPPTYILGRDNYTHFTFSRGSVRGSGRGSVRGRGCESW